MLSIGDEAVNKSFSISCGSCSLLEATGSKYVITIMYDECNARGMTGCYGSIQSKG